MHQGGIPPRKLRANACAIGCDSANLRTLQNLYNFAVAQATSFHSSFASLDFPALIPRARDGGEARMRKPDGLAKAVTPNSSPSDTVQGCVLLEYSMTQPSPAEH
jgi:hypothetical protein